MREFKLNKQQTQELENEGFLLMDNLLFVVKDNDLYIAELVKGPWTCEYNVEEE